MNTPKSLLKQFKFYEANGFHAVEIEPRSGSHYRVVFKEFSQPQFLSRNGSDQHALKNNIARFRRLQKDKT